MSNMNAVYQMVMNNKKGELLDWLETRMSKSAAKISAEEFMKAAKEIKDKECQK